jgi:hypothetical protein
MDRPGAAPTFAEQLHTAGHMPHMPGGLLAEIIRRLIAPGARASQVTPATERNNV